MQHTNMALHCVRACRQYLLHLAHDNVEFRLPVQTFSSLRPSCQYARINLSECTLDQRTHFSQFNSVLQSNYFNLNLRSNCVWQIFIYHSLNYCLQEIKALLSLRNRPFDTSETFSEKVIPNFFSLDISNWYVIYFLTTLTFFSHKSPFWQLNGLSEDDIRSVMSRTVCGKQVVVVFYYTYIKCSR